MNQLQTGVENKNAGKSNRNLTTIIFLVGMVFIVAISVAITINKSLVGLDVLFFGPVGVVCFVASFVLALILICFKAQLHAAFFALLGFFTLVLFGTSVSFPSYELSYNVLHMLDKTYDLDEPYVHSYEHIKKIATVIRYSWTASAALLVVTLFMAVTIGVIVPALRKNR